MTISELREKADKHLNESGAKGECIAYIDRLIITAWMIGKRKRQQADFEMLNKTINAARGII